ncbi:Alpha-galactosidase precursor [Acidisarcina polymorpha]|uniref:Alpha-galactosidase n=2 Tax=Acidisarcina polymorpha TaxID=2211140 RepID=A0A2Z5GBB3_9BACT|nr:Alpha-galactosidase precursor [Acidisarcina polymorpha]
MGWNSWDSFGPSVRENEVKANADFIAGKLLKFGWQYVVVDIEWYQPDAHAHGYIARGRVTMDKYGRFVPSENRFPSAADGAGFKPLADYIHTKGLKFGIHIMRGIPREAVDKNLPIEGSKYHAADVADKVNVCQWKNMEDTYGVDMTKPGAQDYYDSIARLYASWGVDFVKADDMSRPFRGPEIHALSIALRKTGRPIVLSLSPGPAPVDEYAALSANANMWRISNDFWDRWIDIKEQFERAHRWEGKSQPGGWPDADMLPLGHIAIRGERGDDRKSLFTHDEQITLMSLWSTFRSPLMMGGDLPSSDDFTLGLLSNPEVLDVDQKSSGGHQSYDQGAILAWTADAPGGTAKYVPVFNTGDAPAKADLKWNQVGVDTHEPLVRDLWTRQDLGQKATISLTLQPHASVLYKVSGH